MAREFPIYVHKERAKVISTKGIGGDYPGIDQLREDYGEFETEVTNNLTAFARRIRAQLDVIPRFSIDVVEQLPTTDISTATIYLVSSGREASRNTYKEYIYYNNDWEFLGTVESSADMTNYYTKAEAYRKEDVDGKLGNLILS